MEYLFPKKLLDEYLLKYEEGKRDHRLIGKNMGLFTFSNKVGQTPTLAPVEQFLETG